MNIEERKRLDAELAKLNKDVKDAITLRKKWMDEHMPIYARFKVGDVLYTRDGHCLGCVCEVYRYWAGRDERYDTCMSINYRFTNGSNTSSKSIHEDQLCTYEQLKTIRETLGF